MSDQAPGNQQADINWEDRYKGASRIINELTASKKTLEDQLAASNALVEQLRVQLSSKDVEKSVSATEYQNQLQKALADVQSMKTELADLRAYKAKLDTAKKLGATHLMPIIDRIPYVDDPVAMETIIKDFSNWGDQLKQEVEKRILAGSVPSLPSTPPTQNLPTTLQEWQSLIASTPTGPGYEDLMKKFWTWGQSQSRR